MTKRPKTEVDPSSYMQVRPSWRLGNLRMRSPFGWDTISRSDMVAVIAHLKSLETMTWSAILVGAKKQNYNCNVSDLAKPAREIIEQDWQGADKVLSIRLTNTKRMWGIVDQGILHLLWWDPAHEVMPSTYHERLS